MTSTMSMEAIWFAYVQKIDMCILCFSPNGKECGCNYYIQDQEHMNNFNKGVIQQLSMCYSIAFSNNETIIFPNITTQERDQMKQYFMHDWDPNSYNANDVVDALKKFITSGIELRT